MTKTATPSRIVGTGATVLKSSTLRENIQRTADTTSTRIGYRISMAAGATCPSAMKAMNTANGAM